ncbi:GNAT family N-acetyltransferase [Planktothrix agardhii]|jgi:GNAT superfamily N-acetyltransferase|nr:GNAT family N-acetyltransferase [Planktothrix agardhii]MBG0747455.1 N-acetyltransferase [Planktothrix agardhii KL2]MCB8753188.1 N-acetyltransferase [Planktothrix agardhii 1810]MCB8760884.1 N-acetyltransferase [Planktothrix agardhii 1813]MCB8763312.1 N-acetyltransferase [Planktothrix agardhii 1809]MCB8776961.1 N-acetyltransferase [Planktothrix agardhii 1031]
MYPTNSQIEFKPIQHLDHPDFESAIALYEQTFPSPGQIPIPWIQEGVLTQKTQLWLGYFQQELALISILYPLPDSNFILLAYLATVPHLRNIKIGSQFLNYLIDLVKKESKTLVLEVEHPDFGDNRELKQRRIAFYKRLGAKELQDIIYIFPALDGTKTTEMILMIIDNSNSENIQKKVIQKLVRELYIEVYHLHPDQPIFNWIEDIQDNIALI